jgi:hypothetical protein
MDDFLQRIADEWRERAPELGNWAMTRLVNRTDVWGRYLAEKYRDQPTFGAQKNKAITAPFRQERGKIFLQTSSLEKHFKAKDGGGVLGLHSASSDGASQWLAIDIDLHDDDDLSVTREGNFVAAKTWYEQLQDMGFDPLLMDSNGNGGFHLLVLFEKPMETKSVRQFCERFVSDFSRKGLDQAPDVFPGNTGPNHYGSWLRIPGRHHTRNHFTRVWNDESWGESQWLEGHEAIDALLSMVPAPVTLLESHGFVSRRRTICLDFDGVVHSYLSGWHGDAVIPDPPIHRVDQAIARLRKDFRVVIYSARCRNQEGVQAIEDWLAKNEIEVDDVCKDKPPAHVYVDDRAVRFTGDWDETITSIYDFRK